jgi:hypothetical protein
LNDPPNSDTAKKTVVALPQLAELSIIVAAAIPSPNPNPPPSTPKMHMYRSLPIRWMCCFLAQRSSGGANPRVRSATAHTAIQAKAIATPTAISKANFITIKYPDV